MMYMYVCVFVCVFTEATIRFLKAKLRVMQEELDHVCEEMGMKVSHGCGCGCGQH